MTSNAPSPLRAGPFPTGRELRLGTAVRHGVQDVMINSGQTCTALTRMLIPRSRYAEALELARGLRTGQCFVNGSAFNYRAPFGGYKQSGNGREWGEEGLAEFVENKAIQC